MRITKYRSLLNSDRLPCLVKETALNYHLEGSLSSPEEVKNMLNSVFRHGYETEEVAYLICFDIRMKPVGVFEISRGTIGMSVMNPREIIMKALLCNATTIIVAHNHPSGDATPSQTDIETSKRINEACKIVGLKLADSLIISTEQFCSLKQGGEI